MRKALTWRFWLETGAAIVTGILFIVTLLWQDWIEILFDVEPDQGGGLLEWSIVGALLVVTIVLAILARYEWRKARIAIS
jgi:tetrahydromethanopterin S-methyltransferase subunit E